MQGPSCTLPLCPTIIYLPVHARGGGKGGEKCPVGPLPWPFPFPGGMHVNAHAGARLAIIYVRGPPSYGLWPYHFYRRADYCRGTLTRTIYNNWGGHRSPAPACTGNIPSSPALTPPSRLLPVHACRCRASTILPVHAQGGLRGECMHAGAGPQLLLTPARAGALQFYMGGRLPPTPYYFKGKGKGVWGWNYSFPPTAPWAHPFS
jgi:hypothetical protein